MEHCGKIVLIVPHIFYARTFVDACSTCHFFNNSACKIKTLNSYIFNLSSTRPLNDLKICINMPICVFSVLRNFGKF